MARRHEIEWDFNPPFASHHGGVWERLIRTVRKVLYAILYSAPRMTDELLNTVFCDCENVVNSRPITKCSDDPSDDAALTPNHLLLLGSNASFPWGIFHDNDAYRRRWRYVQHITTLFWRRWIKEYLPLLQQRPKWLNMNPNIQKGSVVLIMDENSPRGAWPLGLVLETKQGRDGLVRSAKLKTKTSVLVRPISKLVLLEGSY